MGARKQRSWQVTITIRFDKPVYRNAAISAARNNCYGEIYPTIEEEERFGYSSARFGRSVK